MTRAPGPARARVSSRADGGAFPARLVVHPGATLAGGFEPPGDKSITHRAFLLAALARGESRIAAPNLGADAGSTLACVRALGALVHDQADAVSIEGVSGAPREPDQVLDCGNSGTTLRLLAGPLAAQPFFSVLTGDASLRRRPVDRIVTPLRAMGAELRGRAGDRLPPLAIRGGHLKPLCHSLPMASAQVASAILLAGLWVEGATVVELPGEARDHTERMLPCFGVPVEIERRAGLGPRLTVRGPAIVTGSTARIPGDFSAAAFFLAAAAATPGASVTARDVGLNPTRSALLDVLEAMGAHVRREATRLEAAEPVGDVTVTGPDRLRPFDVPDEWVPRLVDEVPAWIVAAARAAGTSRITGAAELRIKESDRLAALAAGLTALGIAVEERRDGLAVTGGTPHGGTVESRGDHRIAMAFAVLGTLASAPVTVEDTRGIATSYPGFVDTLRSLGGRVETGAVPHP
jgi:3-phosphoshikimate 1-carboxyvinyltransferase